MTTDLQTLAIGLAIAYATLATYAAWLHTKLTRIERRLEPPDEPP